MPVSSVIVGVDLVPITPVRNVITFQSDITTEECSKKIESTLSGWKADIVLHDGAPNVGKNWLHDSYSQNVLVINALKIACEHLNKGGWFVTKVFRSSDYNSLIWVFGKLFGKVHATKPQASRQESAEIFVVCQNYKKPDEIDPRFFDPSSLFADISDFDDTLKKQKADLLKPANKIKKTKAHGYEDDVLKVVNDVEFVTSNHHMNYLAQCQEIKLGNQDILSHESTDEEIKECCRDLKVLGRKDLLKLLKWRRTLRKDLTSKLINSEKFEELQDKGDIDFDQMSINSDDDNVPALNLDDFESIQNEEKRKELKRIKRKEEKRNKDYKQRVSYGMVNQGDVLVEEEHDLFSLNRIGNKAEIKEINDAEPDELVEEPEDLGQEPTVLQKRKRTVTFSREADVQYFELDQDYDEDKEEDHGEDSGPEKEIEQKIEIPKTILKGKGSKNNVLDRLNSAKNTGGGLLTDLMDVNQAKISAATKFFDQKSFGDIDLVQEFEDDLVSDLTENRNNNQSMSEAESNISSDDEDKDIGEEHDLDRFDSDTSSEDESTVKPKKQIKLDPEGLAMAAMMVSSKKHRETIESEGWNRYTHGDSYLAPKWFREDEAKHCRRNTPVTPELVQEYRQRLREIDAKPIKKVIQAKARKKRKAMRKMERVKKKVEAITSNEDITQRERVNQIKTVYKNATKTKKKEVKLVVGRKGLPTKKPTKAKYKMVDSRMKKDLRGKQSKQKRQKSGGKQKGNHKPKGKKSSFKKHSSSNKVRSNKARPKSRTR